uniref:Uncharacterized protein n=1 Tax=Picea glauca TaxID=3330 RepID=A0A101LZB5_PICGL|nr:hypothetical protein ABT39_MTgene5095 [Picea glauca]QHR87724.1 hypothetical protein Q903MT_gene1736 [Picea sitchensis]
MYKQLITITLVIETYSYYMGFPILKQLEDMCRQLIVINLGISIISNIFSQLLTWELQQLAIDFLIY